MKVQVGKTIAAICGLQTAYGVWMSWPVWVAMWREGLVNSAGVQPERQAAIWLIAFGQIGMLLGFLADWADRTTGRLPGCFGWSLIGFVAIVGLFMPASGVWLLLIPAIAGIVQAKRTKRARRTAASGQTPR